MIPRPIAMSVILLTILSGACAEETDESGVDARLGALAAADCGCEPEQSQAECKRVRVAQLQTTLGASLRAGRTAVNPDYWSACIEAAKACPSGTPKACARYLTGALEEDAPCLFDHECASYRCDSQRVTDCAGRCKAGHPTATGAMGSYCNRNADCDDDLVCISDGGRGMCTPPLAAGEPCLEAAEARDVWDEQLCADGLACVSDGEGSAHCGMPLSEGEACEEKLDNTQCEGRLFCDRQTGNCSREVGTPIGTGGGFVCDPFLEPTTCAEGMYCARQPSGQGACQPLKAMGEACSEDRECAGPCVDADDDERVCGDYLQYCEADFADVTD